MPIIVACPSCNGQLRVADDLIGRKVRCPACNTTFDAAESAPAPAPDLPFDPEPAREWQNLNLELSSEPPDGPDDGRLPPARNGPASPVGAVEIETTVDEHAPGRKSSGENPLGGEERVRRRRDDNELSCSACGERLHSDDTRCPACGERIPEKRRRSRRDDDDDDYPRRRRMRRDWEPHRGGMILTFGIVSAALITFSPCYGLTTPIGIGFGIAAWVMGSSDLKKIRAGQMDPEGEGNTQAGWICGIIGVCLNTLALLSCGGFLFFIFYIQTQTVKQFRNVPQGPPAAKRPF